MTSFMEFHGVLGGNLGGNLVECSPIRTKIEENVTI